MRFLGTYADLRGYRVGQHFLVEEIAGRNPGGEPRWKVVCQHCGQLQVLPHSKLAPLVQGSRTQKSLQCVNAACAVSRQDHDSETFEQFRRRIRREEAQASREAAATQQIIAKDAAAQAAKREAKEARLRALRDEYGRYARHAYLRWGRDLRELPGVEVWSTLRQQDRERLLAQVDKEIAAERAALENQ